MDAGRQDFGEGVTARVTAALAAVVVLVTGCARTGDSMTGPVQAKPVNGWSLEIDNEQHSRVWTFNGFDGCITERAPDIQFGAAGLVNGQGTVSVRAGLDVTGQVPAAVEPKPLRKEVLPLDRVTAPLLPVTGCPDPARPVKFSFEVTSDAEWSADGFQVDYRTAGVTYILQWQMPVTACGPSGC